MRVREFGTGSAALGAGGTMPKIAYKTFNFSASTASLIETCNRVVSEYTAQGFKLTLRQLYYQLVSRDIIPNQQKEYKRVGSIVNDARLAGLIDWDAIEDRTRNLETLPNWDEPADIVKACATQFHVDMWANQKYRPEVWIEKDALVGVIEGVCQELDVPFFSCRGYTSQSEMWGGAMRLLAHAKRRKQTPIIFHLGDHDPSGKDMTRDIIERMELFMGGLRLERLALNMNQVEKYGPPPNPAKTTDSRYAGYIAEFGAESWELDALEPAVIAALIRNAVGGLIDNKKWNMREKEQKDGRRLLAQISENWESVVENLDEA